MLAGALFAAAACSTVGDLFETEQELADAGYEVTNFDLTVGQGTDSGDLHADGSEHSESYSTADLQELHGDRQE